MRLWKNFYNENFPIYGNDITRMLFPGVLNVLFFYGSMKHLSSQVNLVAIWGRLYKLLHTVFASCMMHEKWCNACEWGFCVKWMWLMCNVWDLRALSICKGILKLRKTKKKSTEKWLKANGYFEDSLACTKGFFVSFSSLHAYILAALYLHNYITICLELTNHNFFFSPSGISLTCGSQARWSCWSEAPGWWRSWRQHQK